MTWLTHGVTVLPCQGAGFIELDTVHPGQLVSLLSGHLTVLSILLVANQHNLSVGRAVLACVVNPPGNIEEGRAVCDVIHHHHSLGGEGTSEERLLYYWLY